VLRGGA